MKFMATNNKFVDGRRNVGFEGNTLENIVGTVDSLVKDASKEPKKQ